MHVIDQRSWDAVDFVMHLHELGVRRGAEIGVLQGDMSSKMTRVIPDLHMILVDPWLHVEGYNDVTNASQLVQDCRHNLVKALMPQHTVIRKTSVEAAKEVEDGSLDFVYIDADHTLEAVLRDIEAWHPKLKPDGILAGHDFSTRHLMVVQAVCDTAIKWDRSLIIYQQDDIWRMV